MSHFLHVGVDVAKILLWLLAPGTIFLSTVFLIDVPPCELG